MRSSKIENAQPVKHQMAELGKKMCERQESLMRARTEKLLSYGRDAATMITTWTEPGTNQGPKAGTSLESRWGPNTRSRQRRETLGIQSEGGRAPADTERE